MNIIEKAADTYNVALNQNTPAGKELEKLRRGTNFAGTFYQDITRAIARVKEGEKVKEEQVQISQGIVASILADMNSASRGTMDFVKAGMSEYYREKSGETQEELQSELERTQYTPEYDPYLRRDQINNNKEILETDIDIKDNIDYTEPETMYPKKDKDSRIAQQPEFHEPDREDSGR